MYPRRLAVQCTGLLAFATACGGNPSAPRPAPPQQVRAEVSAQIATVVTVTWSTATPSRGRVRYGPTDALEDRTPSEPEPTRQHRRTLLGLAADTEYFYQIVTDDPAAASPSPVATVSTGPLPAGLPPLEVRGKGHAEYTVLPTLGSSSAILILDGSGQVVWYHRDERALDFYRARLSRDGTALLYNAASVSADPTDDTELVRVTLDGSETSARAVPLLAHDFVELPSGTLAAIVADPIEFAGTSLQSNRIVEIEPTGDQRTVWRATDCFDPGAVPGDAPEHAWTLANALDYDPAADAYYLGMRNLSSIAKIDRESGSCVWVLGGAASTFEFAAGSARFLHQHQFDVVGNHIVVMDNDGSRGGQSRVIEYELDLTRGVATEVWRYVADPSVYTFVLGEPSRLANGDTFVNWAVAGQLERVTPAGESIWQLSTRAGYILGFHTLAPSLYPEEGRDP